MLRRIARALVASVVIGLVLLACLEGMCRVVVLSNDTLPVDFVPDPHLSYRLRPNSSVVSAMGIPIATNSLGLRDREYAVPKPPGVFRVLVIGDSQTFGYGVRVEDVYAERLERALNERAPGRYEVINAGVSGYSTHDDLEFLRHGGLDLQPDLIVYGFPSINFSNDPLKLEIRDGVGYEPGGVRLPPFVKKLLRHSRLYLAVAYVRNALKKPAAPAISPAEFFAARWPKYKPELDALVALCRDKRLPMILAYLPVRQEVRGGQPAYAQLIEQLAAGAGADSYTFLNLLPDFIGAGDDRRVFVEKDCCHPNPRGHELIAQRVGEAIAARGREER